VPSLCPLVGAVVDTAAASTPPKVKVMSALKAFWRVPVRLAKAAGKAMSKKLKGCMQR
jgi:hypothetical protein